MDYQFIRELGHGGQAKVFLARRLNDGKLVTVKQLNIDSVKAWKEYELFHREADILSKLNINGVAKFYDAVECLEDRPACSYIIQEYIEGASLAKMLKEGHRFRTDEVYDILLQMLNILKQLQSMDPPVIHRDIKPSNIMISPDAKGGYKVTLIDFGAVANPQVQSGGSTVAGTYGYMPPEQLMGRPVPASDIYSLGAVAVELFSGVSPAEIQVKDFRLIFEPLVQQLPVAVVNTLRRMLEPKAEERLQDISELIRIFTDYKNENYENDVSLPLKADKNKQLNKKLSEVESIGSPGNMELWQGLPDSTPRAVPEVVVGSIGKMQHVSKESSGILDWLSRHPFMTVYIGIILSIVSFLFTVMGLMAFTIVPQILIVATFFGWCGYSNDSDSGDDKEVNGGKQGARILSNLIENGRKTVATIVDVEYLPLPQKGVIQRHNLVVSQDRPSFRVKYKFNPPDDAREKDLVHECIVHASPETYYSKGDPLPILYQIEKKYFGDSVVSMPYPFPLSDLCSSDLIYKSDSPDFESSLDSESDGYDTDSYEYRANVKPVLDARDRGQLLDAIESKMWLLDKDSSLSIMLKFAMRKILNKDDLQLRCAFIEALDKIYHYATENKTKYHVVQFLKAYFNHEYKGLSPSNEEIRRVRGARYLKDDLLSTECIERLTIYSLDDLVNKTKLEREKVIQLLFTAQDASDHAFDGYFFANKSIEKEIIAQVNDIVMDRISEKLGEHADLSVIDKKMTINENSYDYRNQYKPLITAKSRKQMLDAIDNKVWLNDELDIAIDLMRFGREHVWNTDDDELRNSFMDSLLKMYHYANKQETKDYIIQYVVCFFSNKVPGVSPCFSEFKALLKYVERYDNKKSLPTQIQNALRLWPSS
jgi:serine/threonine protein kinase